MRDIACLEKLNWRCDLPPGSDCEALAQRLSLVGYKPARSLPGSIVMRSAEGHEIVLVPRTLRAGIRLHYMTEQAARRHTAERVFVTLVRGVLGRLGVVKQ